MNARVDYHDNTCSDCQMFRRTVMPGSLDLVYHCAKHGPYADRAQSSDDCPACMAEDPATPELREALDEALPESRPAATATLHQLVDALPDDRIDEATQQLVDLNRSGTSGMNNAPDGDGE